MKRIIQITLIFLVALAIAFSASSAASTSTAARQAPQAMAYTLKSPWLPITPDVGWNS